MTQPRSRGSSWAVPSIVGLLGTAALLAVLALSARVVVPAVAVPGPVVLVGGVVLLGLVRVALLEDWRRRGAAVALPVGSLVMLFGLGPYAGCLVAVGGCSVGVTPQVPLLVTGALATAIALYVDSRRRTPPGGSAP